MKNILLLVFLIFFIDAFSQGIPAIKLKDSSQLRLSSLIINTEIVDNFAITTYDMKFYNELNRTLEGELVFPLGDGQSVSGFAMEVNGRLREAVIVEKELARVAFENTVRQNIDPGLLENTEGNNYKARIYPILPNDYKRVVIKYEQELFAINGFRAYELPLAFKEVLDNFSIAISVFGGIDAPVVKNKEANIYLPFKKIDNGYIAQLQKKNYKPSIPLMVEIPNKINTQKILTNENYFYIYQGLGSNFRLKEKPKKITMLWDASFSSKYKKIDKELELIGSYIEYLKDVEVEVISFNSRIGENERFTIVGGDWSALKKFINDIKYDGGTSLDIFDDVKITSDEMLLFSDGLINLGDLNCKFKNPIYTINSSVSADHEILNDIATNSSGNYINLLRYSVADGTSALKKETFQFLGIKYNKDVEEVYPPKNTNVVSDFSITGKFSKDTTIQLLFGYTNKVVKRIDVDVKKSQNTRIVPKLWAKKKLKSLNKNKEKNRKEIISLAKKHGMITDYTSMLILDRIEDYVKYRIEPPQELMKEYKERLMNFEDNEEDKLEELKERREELIESYEDVLKWYNTSYPKKKKESVKKVATPSQQPQVDSIEQGNNENQLENNNPIVVNTIEENQPESLNERVLDTTKHIISGVITDGRGVSLPGVNIIIKGKTIGTQTDFDGNFSINAEIGEELEILYLGYNSSTITVNNSNTININLEESTSMLEEVVVTGYAAQKRSSITASVTSVKSESFSQAIDGVSMASPSVTIRGASSVTNSQPLYIVDGVVVKGNPTAQMNPKEIQSMQILKPSSAVAIYGSQGGME
ncbi:VIT and vWA domain-containing protein [Aquimarina macrocephali]|uniref:VIT and vWA domain-containing protein n=1 Tax=Aquimarina macrocephali TaxID=666563 RepID=UPI000466ADD6|nr:VIT domain-containing protein [Aquimarina macrocephali]